MVCNSMTDINDRRQAEEKIQNENLVLREEIDRASMFEEIVGSSEALRKTLPAGCQSGAGRFYGTDSR